MHHLTLRVAWHDNRWNGTICRAPSLNGFCLDLPRIRETRKDASEDADAGAAWGDLDAPLGLRDERDVSGFNRALGLNDKGWVPFENPNGVENFQILSPTRLQAYGVYDINPTSPIEPTRGARMSDEQLLTPREAAERIGVSDQTIYNWIADGTVQRYRMKGMKRKRYTIPMGEVERLRRAYEEIVEGNNSGLAVAA